MDEHNAKILAFAGKKGSGKTTLSDFLKRNSYELFGCHQDGVKLINFADPLKSICIKFFGLTTEQCYGTEDQKNSLTPVLWADMPGRVWIPEPEFMTARQVLQDVGSGVFRRINPDCWALDCSWRIKAEVAFVDTSVVINTDCRFQNELQILKNLGAKVIRLTRNPDGDSDNHISEQALTDTNVLYDAVLDNKTMTKQEQSKELIKILNGWGWLEPTIWKELDL